MPVDTELTYGYRIVSLGPYYFKEAMLGNAKGIFKYVETALCSTNMLAMMDNEASSLANNHHGYGKSIIGRKEALWLYKSKLGRSIEANNNDMFCGL